MTRSNSLSLMVIVVAAVVSRAVTAVAADSRSLNPGDVASTTEDGLAFGTRGKTFAILPKGTLLTVTEVRKSWVGGQVVLDRRKHSGGWVDLNKVERDLRAGDIASTMEDGLSFGTRDKTFAILPKGTLVTVTEVRSPWLGGHATVDGKRYCGGWVHKNKLRRNPKADEVLATTEDGLIFGTRDKMYAVLPKGTFLTVTEVRSPWVGGHVTVDGKRYSGGWVHTSKLRRDLMVGDVASTIEDGLAFGTLHRTYAILPKGTLLTVTEVRRFWVGGDVTLDGRKCSGGWLNIAKLKPVPKVEFLQVRLTDFYTSNQPSFEDTIDATGVAATGTFATTRTISREITWTVTGKIGAEAETKLRAGIVAAHADLCLRIKTQFELQRMAKWTDEITRKQEFTVDLLKNPKVKISWYDIFEAGTVDVQMDNRIHTVRFQFPSGTLTRLEPVK